MIALAFSADRGPQAHALTARTTFSLQYQLKNDLRLEALQISFRSDVREDP